MNYNLLYFNYYRRLFELQNENIIPGVRNCKRIQFSNVKLKPFNIPSRLQKCFWKEDAKFNM